MGVCLHSPNKKPKIIQSSSFQNKQSNSALIIKQSSSINNNNNNNTQAININQSPNPEEEELENFSDMPEWPNKYKGLGIKYMKAYKCSLKIDDLIRMRDKFWTSRKDNKEQWRILHQACIYDHIKAEELLVKKNFKTLEGCINQCVDSEGNLYIIPNYCINDPYFELEILPQENIDKHDNKVITIVLSNYEYGELEREVKETITGKELMEAYVKEKHIDLAKKNIRLLFGGGIIKEDEMIFQHKVNNGYKIVVVINDKD